MKNRSLNFELLRILCMLSIVYAHYTGHIGLNSLPELQMGGAKILNSVISIVWAPMVNSFILISGYFLILSAFKFSRLVRIYAETVFYLLVFTVIAYCLGKASIADFAKVIVFFIPSRVGGLWFIRMYLLILVLMPFLNRMVIGLSKKSYAILLCILLFVNTHLYGHLPLGEMMTTPYSIWWYVTVYLIGGYFRLFGKDTKRDKLFWIIITLISGLCIISIKYLNLPIYLHNNSLMSFIFCISLFNVFRYIKIKDNKFISFWSSNIFAVYIIHESCYAKEFLSQNLATYMCVFDTYQIWGITVVLVLITFVICIITDKCRSYLFGLFKFDQRLASLDKINILNIWQIKKQG